MVSIDNDNNNNVKNQKILQNKPDTTNYQAFENDINVSMMLYLIR